MFFGEYSHQLDAKNRIRIPSKFKKGLGNNYVFYKGVEKVISIVPLEVMEKKIEALTAIPDFDVEAEEALAEYLSGVFQAVEDTNGRVVIPEELRHYADIDKDVVTIGVGNRLDLMSKDTREAKKAQRTHSEVLSILARKSKEYGI